MPQAITRLERSASPIGKEEKVGVIPQGRPVPQNTLFLGTVSIKDPGYATEKYGSYEKVLALAEERARATGGNLLYIRQISKPDQQSSSYRIEADILRILKPEEEKLELTAASTPHPDYACIYFTRVGKSKVGLTYDVIMDGEKIYRSTPGSSAVVRVYKTGSVELQAKTEAKDVLSLNVEPGRDYFVLCSVRGGALIGRPELTLLSVYPETTIKNLLDPTFLPRFRASINFGGSYMLHGIKTDGSDFMKQYAKGLRQGVCYGADFSYYMMYNLGIGAKLHRLQLQNSEHAVSDDIKTTYSGPYISYRFLTPSQKGLWYFNFGLGHLHYSDHARADGLYMMTGNTLGCMLETGIDMKPSNHFTVGASLSWIEGTITRVKVRDETVGKTKTVNLAPEDYGGLGHLSVSIGFSYLF